MALSMNIALLLNEVSEKNEKCETEFSPNYSPKFPPKLALKSRAYFQFDRWKSPPAKFHQMHPIRKFKSQNSHLQAWQS